MIITEIKSGDKRRVVNIFVDFYVHHETIFKLTENY